MKKKLYYGLGIGILLACQMGVNSYAGFWTDVTDHALEHVEHTDIVEQADGYVLLENTKKGFASSDTEYGIYDVVNQEWKIAYQGYEDADAENAKYVGDGIFAFQESGADQDDMEQNVILLNAKSGEVTYAAIPKMSLDHLNLKNGYSISIGETDVWDVFVIGENGEYYPTGIRNRCQDSESSWDLDEYYTDGQYAVYTDDRSDFIIYDRDKDEISDFYNPVYAEKIVHTFSQDVDPEVYICDKYLVLTNMLGEDRQYYYTVLTFDGTEYIEPTMCDYATVTEWGNLLVENGDQIEEIKLTDKSRDVAQPVSQLVMTSFEEGSRENEELAMDRKGQAYKNTVEYRYQLLKSGPYDLGDTWYLGGNYETFQGVWYCPYNTGKDVMVTVRLLGDEQVLYESPVINAQNCRQEFEVNVSGVQQLRLEYSGTAGTNDILFGLSDGEFLPAGVSGTVPETKEETVEAAQDVMLYDLYAYQGGFSKTPEVTDNMGNEYYKAIRVSSYGESGTYDIGGKYTTLSGTIAVTKTSQDNDFDRNKRGYVRVYGDDTLLWEDADLTTETKPYEMSVDITGVTDLRVEIQGFGTHLMSEMMSVIFENATLKGNAAVNPASADQSEEQTDVEPTSDATETDTVQTEASAGTSFYMADDDTNDYETSQTDATKPSESNQQENNIELTTYLGQSGSAIEAAFGTPENAYWSSGVDRLVYENYIFDSTYSQNDDTVINRIRLQKGAEGYSICGVVTQMTLENAEAQLLADGFQKLNTGIFYNGTDLFAEIGQDSVYEEKEGGGDWKELDTLYIEVCQSKMDFHLGKIEVFPYLRGTASDVLQGVDGLTMQTEDNRLILENDGVRFEADLNQADMMQSVIDEIKVKGEDSPYCIYGMLYGEPKEVEQQLGFGEGGSGERIDPAGNTIYLWDFCGDEKAISLKDNHRPY